MKSSISEFERNRIDNCLSRPQGDSRILQLILFYYTSTDSYRYSAQNNEFSKHVYVFITYTVQVDNKRKDWKVDREV